MTAPAHRSSPRFSIDRLLNTLGAWVLALIWVLPLLYAIWTAFHPAAYEANFTLTAPLTLENFVKAWNDAPFARYFLNTFILVTTILVAQFVLCTLAAYAFARYRFPGRGILFSLVLLQLLVMPDILIVENYKTMRYLDLVDTIVAIGLPYMASGFGIFLLRQTFMTIPKELDEAARMEGCRRADGVVEGLCAARQAGLSGLRPGLGQPPLEQFPLAADHHQFGRNPPGDRRSQRLCSD